MAILRKIMIFPILGIFLMATSCTAKNQSSETDSTGQKSKVEKAEKGSPSADEDKKAQAIDEVKKSSSTSSDVIPDFSLPSIRNQKVSLSNFLGNKIILINFWATWCPYCVAEIPHLNKIEKSLAEQVKFLSIDIGESSEKVQSFARRKEVLFDILLDERGEVARRYRVKGTPTNIVIDKKGNIVYYGYELNRAEQAIMSLLAK